MTSQKNCNRNKCARMPCARGIVSGKLAPRISCAKLTIGIPQTGEQQMTIRSAQRKACLVSRLALCCGSNV